MVCNEEKKALYIGKTSAKKIIICSKHKLIALREDRSLCAGLGMMMLCQRRPDIDIKETRGLYDFALVPRSMFAPNGSMLHCFPNRAPMAILENVLPRSPDQRGSDSTTTDTVGPHLKVIIIDDMTELQCLTGSRTVLS